MSRNFEVFIFLRDVTNNRNILRLIELIYKRHD